MDEARRINHRCLQTSKCLTNHSPLRWGFLFLPHPRLLIVVVERLVDLFWRHIPLGSTFEYVRNGFWLKTVHIARKAATWQAFD